MPAKIIKLEEARDILLKNRWPRKRILDQDLLNYVKDIIVEVRRRGDQALIDFTERFDGVKLNAKMLKVSKEEIEEAYNKVSSEQISAIEVAKKRIEGFERAILSRVSLEYTDDLGVKIYMRYKPIGSVGCYVPGGRFPYPSTLLMTTVPAKVASVPRVVVCTPPSHNGEIHPLTLVAADICRVDEVYRVGGAQAIAALAYGTETIKPVEKIVGPGNRFVLAAKILVSRDAPIDHPAGPSEIVILADETANPHYIALDLISQAEHGPDSISILISPSARLLHETFEEVELLISGSGVKELIYGDILMLAAEDMDEALDFINEFAPEHLEIIAKDADTLSERVHSAGLILIGPSTPVALSDYCIGTNHVLPTGGYSHAYQSLSVLNFVKLTSVVKCQPEALRSLSNSASILARSEGLLWHALAIDERVKS